MRTFKRTLGGWAYVRCADCGGWTRSYARPPLCRACAVKARAEARASALNDPNRKGGDGA